MSDAPRETVEQHIAQVESESIELRLLTDAIHLKYGYDFRGYAKASLKRRVMRCLERNELENISALQHRVLNDASFFESLLLDLSVAVTEMFRDPAFFQALREVVFPSLAKNEHNKVWIAGCASGEEAYSLAILLKEAGLYDRTKIFATDINEVVLRRAADGILPLKSMTDCTTAYQKSGGSRAFVDYYVSRYKSALLDKSLRENLVFAHHNLATDGVFGEFDLVLCRNVLIYFGRELQDRVLGLFADSLVDNGFLGLGTRESARFSAFADEFESIVPEQRIYQRRPGTRR